MGLPQEDLATFLQWRDNTIRPDVEPGDLDAADAIREQTGKDITAYFETAIDEREDGDPDDDLMTELVRGDRRAPSLAGGAARDDAPPSCSGGWTP